LHNDVFSASAVAQLSSQLSEICGIGEFSAAPARDGLCPYHGPRGAHISLVFREMWETTAAYLQFLALQKLPRKIRVSLWSWSGKIPKQVLAAAQLSSQLSTVAPAEARLR
jgi:hypothetical protein